MTTRTTRQAAITIHIDTRAGRGGPLADAEIHFAAGPLQGLKLIGFAIWPARGKDQDRGLTFPARQYSVNGDRRSFALLRPTGANPTSHPDRRLKDLILDAYTRHQAQKHSAPSDWQYDQDGRLLAEATWTQQTQPAAPLTINGQPITAEEALTLTRLQAQTPPEAAASVTTTSPDQDPGFADRPGTAPAVQTGATVRALLDQALDQAQATARAQQAPPAARCSCPGYPAIVNVDCPVPGHVAPRTRTQAQPAAPMVGPELATIATDPEIVQTQRVHVSTTPKNPPPLFAADLAPVEIDQVARFLSGAADAIAQMAPEPPQPAAALEPVSPNLAHRIELTQALPATPAAPRVRRF